MSSPSDEGRRSSGASASSPAAAAPQLSIITFNMLCPAYKRCHTTVPTSLETSPEAVTVGAGGADATTVATSTSSSGSSSTSSIVSISGSSGGDAGIALHLPPALAQASAKRGGTAALPTAAPSPSPSPSAPSGLLPHGTYPSSPVGCGGRYRESSVASEWRARVSRILRALGEARADIVCLQEWWGVDAGFREMVLAAPEVADYKFITAQRTGGKDDGIAVLLRRRWIHTGAGGDGSDAPAGVFDMQQSVLSRHDISLTGFGNRIGLALQIQVQVTPLQHNNAAARATELAPAATVAAAAATPAANSASVPDEVHHSWAWQHDMQQRVSPSFTTTSSSPSAPALAPFASMFHEFLLVVTHLTFPHSTYDLAQRKLEVCHLLGALDDVQTKALPRADPPLAALPVVLVGDMNTAADFARDFVYAEITKRGFRSTFASVHGGTEPGVTHRNHRRESVPVDFIFLKPGAVGAAATTAPAAAAAASSPAGQLPVLRPLYSTLLPVSLPHSTWPAPRDFTLSDHRPLLTVFEMGGMSARRPTTGQNGQAKPAAGHSLPAAGGSTTSAPTAGAGAEASQAPASAGAASPSPSLPPNPVAGPSSTRVALTVLSSSARHLCSAASRTCRRLFGWSHEQQQAKHESQSETKQQQQQHSASTMPAAALPSRL